MNEHIDLVSRILKQLKGNKKYSYYANKVKEAIGSGKYDNLLVNIEANREDINYKKLLYIFINDKDNFFEIKTIGDIENYEQIRRKSLESLINLDNVENLPLDLFSQDLSEIELYRLTCIERLYGQDLITTKKIADTYGRNIDDISRPELRNYIISLQRILSESNINQLKRLLQISEIDTQIFDSIEIEDELQAEYGRLYEGALFHIDENTPLYQGHEFGDATVYDISKTRKGLMVHVVDGASDKIGGKIKVKNYYDFWNRKDFEKDTCCSFVSPLNPNKRYSARNSVAFGFVGMEDYLVNMGINDMASTYKNGVTIATVNQGIFKNPKSMARSSEEHGEHNEFIYIMPNNYVGKNEHTVQTKKQPDYIVVAKNKEGFIDNVELAVQAYNDFKNAGINVPIVFLDVEQWKYTQLIQDTVIEKELSPERRALLTQLDGISINVIKLLDDRERKEDQETNAQNNQDDLELKKIKVLADSIRKKGLLGNKQAIKMLENRIVCSLHRIEGIGYHIDVDYLKKVEEMFIDLGINANDELEYIKENEVVNNRIEQQIIKKILEEQRIQDFLYEQGYTEEQGKDLALRDLDKIKITEEIMKRQAVVSIKSGNYNQNFGPLNNDIFDRAFDINEEAIKNLIANSTTSEAREELDAKLREMGITDIDFTQRENVDKFKKIMTKRYEELITEAEKEASEQQFSNVENTQEAPTEKVSTNLTDSYIAKGVEISDIRYARKDIEKLVLSQDKDKASQQETIRSQ